MVFARDGCRADYVFVDFFGPFFPALLRSVSDVGMGVMESAEGALCLIPRRLSHNLRIDFGRRPPVPILDRL